MASEAEGTIVRRSASLLEAEVAGELVALHVETGACYGYNLTATQIWALVEEAKTIAEIRSVLLDRFEVDAETCQIGVDALLQQLEADGLVELERVT